MTPMTSTYAAQRRSLFAGTSPLSASFPSTSCRSSVYSVDKQDFLKLQHRNSVMHSPAALLEKLQEFEFRPRSNSRESKESSSISTRPRTMRRKSNNLNQLDIPKPHKPRSGSGGANSSTMVGSLKGRLLRRKTSAPLLSLSPEQALSPIESPTTPTGPAICWSPVAGDLMEGPSSFPNVAHSQPVSFARRKLSTVPDESAEVASLRQNRRGSDDSITSDIGTVGYAYRKLEGLSYRNGVFLHPYPRSDAPYMLSYNKMQLESESFSNLLLRRLNKHTGPSFHNYGFHPPRHVLDLGCGQGSWLLDASEAWGGQGTSVTGFDLVDISDERVKEARGVSWKRGNFVAYRLPFRKDSFDLVRIANLTLCIPRERWEHVLTEVRRVLKPNGRVEIIDDQLMFPYVGSQATSPTSSSAGSSSVQTARSSWNGSVKSSSSGESSDAERRPSADLSPSFLNLELESDVDFLSAESSPGLYSGDSHSDSSCEDLLRTPIDEHVDLSPWGIPDTPSRTKFHEREESQCRDIEGIFESMLDSVHGIDPQPHEFLLDLLAQVFGPKGRARKIEAFHLSLLSPEVHDRVVAGNDKKKWETTLGRESSLRRSPTNASSKAQAEGAMNTKAAKLLGIGDQGDSEYDSPPHNSSFSLKRPNRPRSSSKRQVTPSKSLQHTPPPESLITSSPTVTPDLPHSQQDSHQPAGLFVYPDRFLDMSPRELEMHLTKDIHTLLGCKVALSDFATGLKDHKDESLISQSDWADMIWEYECSRRKRFNLPYDERGFELERYDQDSDNAEDPFASPLMRPRKVTFSASKKSALASTFADLDLDLEEGVHIPIGTPVRSIRVYEAYKIDPPHGATI
ncbi:hypothetical protein SCHPADRAFT_929997 [Schizopora paradoxa]|uniref:Methyltransferase domain-containing protein n=1 Tax=Schizopora paradoxa TaxID=27342 RepID=A0A0H2RHD9_9AGAM|nr:hypothetical protein SCHPADRAFT_929997 [Schizopora paradoxa]